MDMTRTQELIEVLKKGAEAQELEPDEDWAPIIAFIDEKGHRGVGVLPFPEDDGMKEALFSVTSMMLGDLNAVAAAFLSTAWKLELDPTDPWVAAFQANGGKPSDHPDRQEIVSITVVDRSLAGVTYVQGKIVREEGEPPRIVDWTEEYFDHGSTGRIVDMLRDGTKTETAKKEVMH